jgi:serine/threonine-protein kinase
MGEVYRARDTRLDRDVAIKVLPESMARDKERILRFEREAKLLASLNHPNIAAIYGFETYARAADSSLRDDSEGKGLPASSPSRGLKPAARNEIHFLVLEYVEGETLAQRLKRGTLPVEDALEIGKQIAEALEAAHEKGIIHRDLKPGNVMVRPDGTVKVLDFGLARAMGDDSGSATSTSESPTITADFTRPGVILGTAAYMSPEQARGKPIDKRTDIWAFGCVLFELLSGSRIFDGETTSDVIGAILHKEPPWNELPQSAPPLVQLLLRRCLSKNRDRRLRDIGDARVDLDIALHDPTTSGLLLAETVLHARSKRRSRGVAAVVAMLALAVGIGGGMGWMLRKGENASNSSVIRFAIEIPPPYKLEFSGGDNARTLSLDPSGTTLAFVAWTGGRGRIFLREFSAGTARSLPGTENGEGPFFSPDGRWLGFFSEGKLKKVPILGGPTLTICDAGKSDAAWLDDGTIVLTADGGTTLVRVSANGGTPEVLARAGPTQRSADGSQLLLGFTTTTAVPGEDYVLVGVWDGVTIQDYALVSVNLRDGTVRPLMPDAIDPYYVEPGYLVFLRESSVLAAPFDKRRGVVTGEPVQVVDGVRSNQWSDSGQFSVSRNGTMSFVPGGRQGPGRRLVRVDREGKSEPLMEGTDAVVGGMRLSPDGRRALVTTLRRHIDLWSFDLSRRALTLVNNVGESWGPIWTPDGEFLVFQRLIPEQEPEIVRKRPDSSEQAEKIPIESAGDLIPGSFSPDGKLLLLTLTNAGQDRRDDVVLYRFGEPGAVEVVLGSPAQEADASFAPDGKLFAHISTETGRAEVFVRSFPDYDRKWQISQAGGHAPVWSRDGKELFFLDFDAILHSVKVGDGADVANSAPWPLFDTKGIATTDLWGIYDVLPDGSFLMVEPAEWEKQPVRIQVVVNWAAELAGR